MKTLGRTCIVFIFAAFAAGDVRAVDFFVTRADDPPPDGCVAGNCSLREAIIAANDTNGPDEIFLLGVTYRLSIGGTDEDAAATGDLDIASDLVIRGVGAAATIIDANGIDRVFDVDPAQDGVTVEFFDLAIRNGDVEGDGGGIRNRGGVSLNRVSVNDNFCTRDGGGIRNELEATMIITDSAVVENKAGSNAGGIDNSDSSLDVLGSAVNDNEVLEDGSNGGGIDTEDGAPTLRLFNSTVNGNTAPSNGGGIYTSAAATVIITQSDVSGNRAGNVGGGIRAGGSSNFNIARSTISDNESGDEGGGFHVTAFAVTLENSTVSGNRAQTSGGGLFVTLDSIVNIDFSTIADNTADGVDDGSGAGAGGGIFNNDSGSIVNISNSILGDNVSMTTDPDCFGVMTSGGFNLIEVISANCTIAGSTTGNVNADPQLVPLNNNGGPTQTHALQDESPAIDAAHGACVNIDQRSEPRPQDGNNDNDDACDIGAFERSADPPPPAPPVACCGTADAFSAPLLGVGLLSIKLVRRRRAG